jgi:hypothetical protein
MKYKHGIFDNIRLMVEAREIYKKLFPGEPIESEFSGFLNSTITKKNRILAGLPFSTSWDFQPAQKCRMIVGKNYVLIDSRKVVATNIKLLSIYILPIGIVLILIYTILTKNLLFLFTSLFSAWPLPIGLLYAWQIGVLGGANSYLIKKEWINKYKTKPDLIIEGIVPGGEPYILSQYLAINNLEIPSLLSGRSAWLGTEYPLSFVETEFKLKISRDLESSQKITYIALIIAITLVWVSVHLTYLMINMFTNSLSF